MGNALAAAAVGRAVGLGPDQVAAALSGAAAASKWRMQLTDLPDGVTVINDAYNANPDSMRAALRSLADRSGRGGRTWAVLGPMAELGDAGGPAHDEIGRLVVRLGIDHLIVVAATGRLPSARLLHLGAASGRLLGQASRSWCPTSTPPSVLLRTGCGRATWCWSRRPASAGLERVALALIDERSTG